MNKRSKKTNMDKIVCDDVSKYRLNRFIVRAETPEGYLLYNTTTGSIVHIKDEKDLKESFDQLVEMYDYVPIDFDEISWVEQLRKENLLNVSDKQIYGYTILSTMDCNARCFYCYEKGQTHISMSEKTARDVANFIINNSHGQHQDLRWFGGEPLMNPKVIDIICNTLQSQGVIFQSGMISNGLLFNDGIISKAKTLWNLKRVQITLDGTKDVYLKAKSYVRPTGEEFDMVINNIDRLINSKIRVTIRLNQDLYNTENLLELLNYLSKRFSKNNGLSVYNSLLFYDSEREGNGLANARTEAFLKLQNSIIESGLFRINPLKNRLRISHCMADNNSSLLISPNGKIGKCEHYPNQFLVGSIYNSEVDVEILAKWKEKFKSTTKCNNCPLYPQCVRLKMCPEERKQCSFVQCENKIHLIEKALLHRYKVYKRNTY